MFAHLAWIAALAAVASAKISASVFRHLDEAPTTDIVVEFSGTQLPLAHADVGLRSLETRSARLTHLTETLEAHAAAVQSGVKDILASQPESSTAATYESYFISNTLFVYGASAALVDQIAKDPAVSKVRSPFVGKLPVLQFEASAVGGNNTIDATNEWGIELINAPGVWAAGNRGEGVVVGSIDTGALYTHEALKSNWRSNYGWFDPTDKSKTPNDGNGHGTHTIGSSVGANGIGVAPGAQWISCRGCTTDSCPEAALTGCGQWMLCPTDVQGNNKKCELAPGVINNSWGGGAAGEDWYQATVDAWQKAGIIPVFANGNAGPNCATVASPGDYKNVIGVGAVGADDKLASFSSKGPTPDARIKPDVSAPGYKVRSSWNSGNSAYNTISGTSMATPHVTGAVAL
ncbi:hypothetical protein As57867_004421, partial [Aphanomyces stellatus]